MSTFQQALRRLCSVVTAALCMLVLAACGPGVGGTGTGESALHSFGATAANVCTSDFAATLGCTAGATGAPNAASVRYFADGEPASRQLARVQGQGIELELRCLDVQFKGTWGTTPTLGSRYYGELLGAGAASALASLIVQAQPTGLWLLLQDASGNTIIGPLLLVSVAAPTATALC